MANQTPHISALSLLPRRLVYSLLCFALPNLTTYLCFLTRVYLPVDAPSLHCSLSPPLLRSSGSPARGNHPTAKRPWILYIPVLLTFGLLPCFLLPNLSINLLFWSLRSLWPVCWQKTRPNTFSRLWWIPGSRLQRMCWRSSPTAHPPASPAACPSVPEPIQVD